MISSSTLSPSPALDLKKTRPLPLGNATSLDFGKSTQRHNLPHSGSEQNDQQQLLKQHIDQMVEQQVNQITDEPAPARLHQHKPLAVTKPSIELELIDLDSPKSTQTHSHKPLPLGSSTSNSTELHQHKPLDLNSKANSSLDIQLLSEHNTALLIDPIEQLTNILQSLLKNTSQENPLYWIENNPPAAATQVATASTTTPSLAWQDSLWF